MYRILVYKFPLKSLKAVLDFNVQILYSHPFLIYNRLSGMFRIISYKIVSKKVQVVSCLTYPVKHQNYIDFEYTNAYLKCSK
jgi:hypothetical protein